MKPMLFKLFIVIILVGMLLSACGGAAAPAAGSLPSEIVISAVQDLSGSTANYGTAAQKGIDLAVKEMNSQKFFGDGHTVKVVYMDAAGDAKQAAAAYEKLIADKSVVAIIGPTLSTEAMVADPLAQTAKMPVVASSNTVSGIVEMGDYIFRTSIPESAVIPNTLKVAAKAFNLKQVAIMYSTDDAYTNNAYVVFKDALTQQGIKILAEEHYAKGDKDFSAQLAKITPLNPEALIVPGMAEESANIILQARAAGIPSSVPVIGGNGFNSPKLAEIAGPAAEGAIAGTAWNNASSLPASQAFVKAFTAEYNATPDQFSAQSYTAAWVIAVAIKNAGSTEHSAVRDALAKIKNLDTPLGSFSFDEKREPQHLPVVNIVKDGKLVLFQP